MRYRTNTKYLQARACGSGTARGTSMGFISKRSHPKHPKDTALQTIKMQRVEKLKGKAQKLIAIFVLAFLIDA